jgi:hypothetical protein
MHAAMRELLNHRRTRYSQAGEEGVIDEILQRIGSRTLLARYFVEFGAWDGKHLSNTFFLAERGWSGCMIEGDPERFGALTKTLARYPAVRAVNRWVGMKGADSLDAILRDVKAPQTFDVLSIDIDGNDYWVWQSLENFRPKVVVIEINFRDKPGAVRINEPASPFKQGVSGSSITSIRKLGESKGYKLVANVACNAIFVDEQYARLVRPLDEFQAFTYEGFAMRELTLSQKARKLREWLRKHQGRRTSIK